MNDLTDTNMTNLERAKNELRQTINEYFDQGNTTLAYALDDILIALNRLTESPKPTYPAHMLGRWAKHSEYGDVLVGDEHPTETGDVLVSWTDVTLKRGTGWTEVPVSELKFPEQTTKPEDVKPGEAWIVNVDDGNNSYKQVVAVKDTSETWRTADGKTSGHLFWHDSEATLITPLVPARPEPAQEAEWVGTEEEYAALPEGSIVVEELGVPYIKLNMQGKLDTHAWYEPADTGSESDARMARGIRRVLRRGWDDDE